MYEMRARAIATLFAAALVASVAAGQQGAIRSAPPNENLDSAKAAMRRAYAAYVVAETKDTVSQRHLQELPVIVRGDGLVVHADSTWIPHPFLVMLDSAFALASRNAHAVYGSVADTLLNGASATVVPTQTFSRSPRHFLRTAPGAQIMITTTTSRYTGSQFALTERKPQEAATMFENIFSAAADRKLPPAMVLWMRRRSVLEAWDDDERTRAYFALALHASPVGLACVNGIIASCRAALGVVAGGDTIGAWFDAPTRIALVRAFVRGNGSVRDTMRANCLTKRDDRACRDVLANGFVASPTSNRSRAHLVRYALLRGGPEAFRRLVSDTSGDVAAHLERASGIPFDSLVVAWRADVLAGQPASPLPSAAELVSILVSCGALISLVAVKRS